MFTASELIIEIRDLAQLFPDFIYTEQEGSRDECSYLGAAIGHRTGKACIVGQALTRLGVTDEVLEGVEEVPASTAVRIASGDTWPDRQSVRRQLCWMDEVQSNQDEGCAWGDAVRKADRYFAIAAVQEARESGGVSKYFGH